MITDTTPPAAHAADPMRHYAAILAVANARGAPIAWREDLTEHDLRACASRNPDRPFVWVLREHGTNMLLGLDEAENLAMIAEYRGAPVGSFRFMPSTLRASGETVDKLGKVGLFGWDGRRLVELTDGAHAAWFLDAAGAVSVRFLL